VALLREGPAGVEVLTLIRPVRAEFAATALAFPGGRIDEHDGHAAWEELTGTSPGAAAELLGSPWETGEPSPLALLVGAVREVFEESAILLGAPAGMDRAWLEEARRRVHSGETELRDVVHEAQIRLELAPLLYFARWITPVGAPRRYDTRFFAAAAPADQVASPAPVEVESMAWLRPAEALAAAERGEVFAMPPTRAALAALEGPGVEAVLARLRRERNLEPILPQVRFSSFPPGSSQAAAGRPEVTVVLPGDPGHVEPGPG
jgi:8-oxo-dGTP pyrophosphatase MutT (NUDIX family)